MIGHLQGEVLFSDGREIIILTASGIGYQVYLGDVLAEGRRVSLFVSHVQRETSQELYGFKTLREKKMFELLNSVKGVGPKSAFTLLGALGVHSIIDAILMENKKNLTKAPGIGPKAASQMVLDLSGKVAKIKMYSAKVRLAAPVKFDLAGGREEQTEFFESVDEFLGPSVADEGILNDALMACKELGFKEEKIIPLAQKILEQGLVARAEQLVHLVLKEI